MADEPQFHSPQPVEFFDTIGDRLSVVTLFEPDGKKYLQLDVAYTVTSGEYETVGYLEFDVKQANELIDYLVSWKEWNV